MDIRNHRIDDIWFGQTSNLSGTHRNISPKFIVTHYTTGWDGASSRDWLMGAAGGTSNTDSSAHVVIDRDGTAWQIAPFNRRAWHAGPSRYGSLSDINSHGVGLEFVNPGWLKPDGNGGWVDYFGNRRTTQDLNNFGGFELAPHPRVGSATYAWPLYTEAQLATGRAIALALIDKYPIQAIITHEEIDTRGWKTDPGPAFPQSAFIDLLGEDSTDDILYAVNATRLNIRGGATTGAERIDPPGSLPQDTTVKIIRAEAGWAFIEVVHPTGNEPGLEAGLRGWVSMTYLDRIF